MIAPWWGKEVDPALAAKADDASAGGDVLAPLTTVSPEDIEAEITARRVGFTPTWTSQRPDDPGSALIAVYGELHAALAGAVDQLPRKARVEHLVSAGVVRRAPRPLGATLVFEISESAPGSIFIGDRFEVLGKGPAGETITFETDRELYATAAKLAVLGTRLTGTINPQQIPTSDKPGVVHPFGERPERGAAIYLGLDASAPPSPQLAIGFSLAPLDGAPPPVSAGGLLAAPGAEPPRLRWELFDRGTFAPVAVIRDETRSFTQSGVVELAIPSSWRAGSPPGSDPTQPHFWLRCSLLDGEWPSAPALDGVTLNAVPATSGRTIRDEIVETPVSVDPIARRTLTLANSPVLDGTLQVEIDEGGAAPLAWQPVDDLADASFDARVFRFDATTGTLTFGDGRNGRALPEGFRNVHATYRVAEVVTSVAAKQISTAIGEAPFLASVTNPAAATGGSDAETLDEALRRGPRDIRARGRAVAVADYEVLALRAPKADIRRARAIAGFHPRFPGAAIPGVVGVLVVGNKRDDGQPPIPNEPTLEAVSAFLASSAAHGAEVVAAAPVFHAVRIEATVELDRDADATETIHRLSSALDRWFDPVVGGATGEGWPFGGAIGYDALVRFVLRELADAVIAIPRLLVVVDGVRAPHCSDVAIPPRDLLWPAPHELGALPRRTS